MTDAMPPDIDIEGFMNAAMVVHKTILYDALCKTCHYFSRRDEEMGWCEREGGLRKHKFCICGHWRRRNEK